MSPLKQQVHALIEAADFDGLDLLVKEHPRAIRHLVAMTYRADETSEKAARGIAIAARYHDAAVQKVIRQLVWAMNDESGTNGLSAPPVLKAIAVERADLLLPMVPDLLRLCHDEGLRDGLSATLQIVAEKHPGTVGPELAQQLTDPDKNARRDNERLRRYKRQRDILSGADEGDRDR